jgi:transposase
LSVLVYDDEGKEVDFKKCLAEMNRQGVEQCEMNVFIGKDRLPVRLYIGRVPPEVYEQRLRRKSREGKKKGWQMKERTKAMLWFNLFITNVEEGRLPAEKIVSLYRFRWQVELMFKNWKSLFAIHAFQKMKEERYITMLYIRLILIIVNLQIINMVQSVLYKEIKHSVLSLWKALLTLKNNFPELLNVLRGRKEKGAEFLEKICRILSKNHWREKRKKRANFIENISLFICVSND